MTTLKKRCFLNQIDPSNGTLFDSPIIHNCKRGDGQNCTPPPPVIRFLSSWGFSWDKPDLLFPELLTRYRACTTRRIPEIPTSGGEKNIIFWPDFKTDFEVKILICNVGNQFFSDLCVHQCLIFLWNQISLVRHTYKIGAWFAENVFRCSPRRGCGAMISKGFTIGNVVPRIILYSFFLPQIANTYCLLRGSPPKGAIIIFLPLKDYGINPHIILFPSNALTFCFCALPALSDFASLQLAIIFLVLWCAIWNHSAQWCSCLTKISYLWTMMV